MHPALAQHRSGIAAICQSYRIHRLEVFRSAARADDFDPESSDADFLVEFTPDVQPGLDTLFGAKAALEALLGRGVNCPLPACGWECVGREAAGMGQCQQGLGALAVFFCSPAGNNVRGVAWNMDGGWTAQ